MTDADASSVDSSTTTEAQPEQNSEAAKPVNQEAVNKRFNEITAQKYEFKSRAEAAEQKIQELEARLSAQPVETLAQTPAQTVAMPDPNLQFDNPEQWQAEMAEYNRKIATEAAQKTFDERQRIAAQDAEKARQREQLQQDQLKKQQAVAQSALNAGIDMDEVDKAAGVLSGRGINYGLVDMISQHEQSAALFTHLAQNPADYDQVNGLTNPYEMVRKLDEMSKNALQRKVTLAPDPVQTLTGMPAREQTDFEKQFPNAKFK